MIMYKYGVIRLSQQSLRDKVVAVKDGSSYADDMEVKVIFCEGRFTFVD